MFTVVVQKGQKLIVGENEHKAEVRRGKKNGMKQRKESIKTFPPFLLRLSALEVVTIVVMFIKLQTPMKVYIAVIAILKKQTKNKQVFYFPGALKIQRV